jgi:hypothetical protein
MNYGSKVAGGRLMNATDSKAETYNNLLDNMVKENCYGEWLSHKQSAKH